MKSHKSVFILLISLIGIMSGCVSDGSSQIEFHENPPDWFLSPPKDDNSFMYFTGLGASTAGKIDAAEELAIQDLVASICAI